MKRFLTLAAMAAANVVITFGFQAYIFAELGAGRETDALFAGMAVPQVVLAVVSGSLTYVLIPLLSPEDDEAFRRNAWTFLFGVGTLFCLVAVALALFAPWWVPVLFPGFGGGASDLAIAVARIQLVGMVFTALTGVLWAAAHARQRFVLVEFTSICGAIPAFVFLYAYLPRFGVRGAAWALVARAVVQALLLVPLLGRPRMPNFKAPQVAEAWARLRPLLLGTVYYKSDYVVDRYLASLAPPGDLSLLQLAVQLYGAGHQVLSKAVTAPGVPLLSIHSNKKDWSAFAREARRRLALTAAVAAAALVGVITIGLPVLRLLFEHRRFDPQSTHRLWLLLIALGGTWIGGALGQTLSTSFYALGDTRTPTVIGIIGFTTGIFLKLGLFHMFSITGVALGSTTYFLINAALMFVLLRRRMTSRLAAPGNGYALDLGP